MSSIIKGYNYDIFISYRQKDNKGDKWVSEFVEALKTELESTFKEEISVYFDINPHDGLLETHDVDESLKEKLKCLVFIPIISRTYCDSNAFAWEHEFKAFIEQASKDQYGLKVKLPGGNVANRVLPVQIHELDAEDKRLVENELGGHLRGIEFIYKEPGVNRPLMANEDHPDNNLNKTFYRNQINKVANAIKEVITAIKQYNPEHEEVSQEVNKPISSPRKNYKTTIIAGSVIVLVLIVLGFLFALKLFKPSGEIEKSIAVLPFNLLSDEPDKQYLADGMVDAITLHLSKIKGLRVMSRTSGEQYRGTTKTTRTIGKELDVEYLLEGSFQKFGDDVKLIVQLINASEESHEWANEYNSKWSDIFSLQSEIAQKIAKEMSVAISPEEKDYINKAPTTDLRAYDFYLRGFNELWRLGQHSVDRESIEKAEILFSQALHNDSSFALAYVGMGHVYWKKSYLPEYDSESLMDSVLVLSNIALSYDDKLAEAYYLRGAYFYFKKGDVKKTEEEWDKAIKVNPNQWHVYSAIGWLPTSDLITQIENLIKAASLNHDIGFSDLLSDIGDSFFEAGFPEKATFYYNEVLKLDGDSVRYLYSLANAEQNIAGNYNKSLGLLGKICAIDSTFSQLDILFALNYLFAGQYEKSLLYLNRLKSTGRINFDWIAEPRIASIYWINGYKKEAESYFDKAMEINQKRIVSGSDDPNSHYNIACIYAVRGERKKAIEHLKLFNKYEIKGKLSSVTYIKNDPLFNNIRNEPEFQQIVSDAEAKHQAEHEKVRKWLEENNML
jgi:TolB-like protein/Tfp pilus assembly protein PilF